MVTRSTLIRQTILVGVLSMLTAATSCRGQSGNPAETTSTQVEVQQNSGDAYQQLIASAKDVLDRDEFGLAVMKAGISLKGSPYIAGLLDKSDREDLVINLDGFDCVLLVETALAGARAAARGAKSVEGFAQEIESLRYRDGKRDGYSSRLHYFSDWILNNDQRGIVDDITLSLGGEQYKHTLDFMSANRELYPKIADDDSLYSRIAESEKRLRTHTFYYIPQERIVETYSNIRPGDIIAITTSVKGLDISHTGIAFVEDGNVGFLHASTSKGVTVAADLSEYVNSNKKQTGIMVARPLIPADE